MKLLPPRPTAFLLASSVLAGTVVACGVNGVLFKSHTYFWQHLQFSQEKTFRLAGSQAITFLGDLPSLILAGVSLASAVLYGVLFSHLRKLPQMLSDGQLIKGHLPQDVRDAFWRPVSGWQRWTTITSCAGIAILFYLLANAKIYPQDWWAHLRVGECLQNQCAGQRGHLIMAIGWTSVGYLGFVTALLQMLAFLEVLGILRSMRSRAKMSTGGLIVEYVPNHLSDNHGFSPLWRLMKLKILGALLFVPTLFALYLLFIVHQFTIVLLIAIAVLTLAVTIRQFSILNEIPAMFEDAVDRRLEKEISQYKTLTSSVGIADFQLKPLELDIARISADRNTERRGTLLFGGRIVTLITLLTALAAVIVPVTFGK